MITKTLLSLAALVVGGWMLFDGIHVMSHGKYFGPPDPGAWSLLPRKLGLNPFKLGPVFITFGLLWLLFLGAHLAGRSWGWYGAVGVAVGTLWYLPLGTVLSIVYLVLLFLSRPGV